MLHFMCRRKLNTNSCFSLWHYRKEKTNHINTFLQQAGRKFLRQFCIIQHHRHDRMISFQNIKSCLHHFRSEERRVGKECRSTLSQDPREKEDERWQGGGV